MMFSNYFMEFYSMSISKSFPRYLANQGNFKLKILYLNTFYLIFILCLVTIGAYKFYEKNFYLYLEFENSKILIFSIIYGLIISIDALTTRYLNAKLDFFPVAVFNTINNLSILIFFFYCIYFLDLDIYFIIKSYLCLLLFFSTIFWLYIFIKYNFKFQDFAIFIKMKDIAEIAKYTYPLVISSILILSQVSIPRFFVNYYFDKQEFANFSLHFQFAEITSMFFIGSYIIFRPIITKFYYEKKFKNINNILIRIFELLLVISCFYIILFNFFGKELFLIINKDLYFNIIISIFLCLSSLLFYLFFFVYEIIIINKQEKNLFIFFVIVIIFNVISAYVLIPFLGVTATALASFLSNLLLVFLVYYKVNKITKFFFFNNWSFYLQLLLFIIFGVLFNYFSYTFFYFDNLFFNIAISVVAILVFNLFLSKISIINNIKLLFKFLQ